MTDAGEIIKSKNQVNILGVKFNAANDMSSHVSSIASCVGRAYKNLQPFIKHASLAQRRVIIRAKVESIALYASPLVFNESESTQKRLKNILMKINKWILQENWYKKKNKDICEKIKVEEPEQKLLKNNVLYICKIMQEREVQQILNKMIINKRAGSKVYMRNPQKPMSKSSIIRHVSLFNALPLDLKNLSIQRLKRKLRKMQVQFKD